MWPGNLASLTVDVCLKTLGRAGWAWSEACQLPSCCLEVSLNGFSWAHGASFRNVPQTFWDRNRESQWRAVKSTELASSSGSIRREEREPTLGVTGLSEDDGAVEKHGV